VLIRTPALREISVDVANRVASQPSTRTGCGSATVWSTPCA